MNNYNKIDINQTTVERTGSNAWGDSIRPLGSQSRNQEFTPLWEEAS